MNKGSGVSNWDDLSDWIHSLEGETVAEQCAKAITILDTRMSLVGQGSDTWQDIIQTKGLVEALIRFNRKKVPFLAEVSKSAIAA